MRRVAVIPYASRYCDVGIGNAAVRALVVWVQRGRRKA